MRKQLLLVLFVTTVGSSYGQLHFLIDNTNPCPGQSVTFALPTISECSNPRVLSEADWNIFPAPFRAEVSYNFSAQNGVQGYVSVTLTYSSYYPTISVHATYACNGKPTGTVSDLILMAPPLADPTISGLDGNIYSGDQITTTVSAPNATGYSWNLSPVGIISGDIDESAIVSPFSQQTVIDWPPDFVGVVDIIATVRGCSETKQTTRRISVLTPPSAIFYESSVTPAAPCPGTSMRYRLEVFGGFTITQARAIVSGGATNISVFNTTSGVPVEWSVKWMSTGDIRIQYSVSNGSRTWDFVTPNIAFDVLQFDAGQIHPIPLDSYCAPTDVALSLDRQPTGSVYSFQYCNTGDCGVASSNWIDNDLPGSSVFDSISINTSFRIKLTDNRCGTFQSMPVNISVKLAPSLAVSGKTIFSGGTFDIPPANMPFSTIDVKVISTGVTGASDVSILQGSAVGTLATQTLMTDGQSDGTAIYSITPSKDGCAGETKHATVTVYRQPVIEADRNYVFKGLKATLKTGSYDSYSWQTVSGKILGVDPTYQAAVPDVYIVTVTKNGITATSAPIMIGGQFFDVNENYVLTRQPSREFKSIVGLEDLTEQDVTESIQYIDGLGRPLQNINIRMSPTDYDIVQPIIYDQYGREVRKFLPYVSSEGSGRIRPNAISFEQPEFYRRDETTIPSDPQPYIETVVEASPLNRILKQGAAGSDWQPNRDHPELEHVIRYEYLLNSVADSVMRFSYDYENKTLSHISRRTAYYPVGVLNKNKTIDEDNHEMIEFVDKLNRTVCKKVYAGENKYACTYYVYDDIGNLVVVIPPEGAKSIMFSLAR